MQSGSEGGVVERGVGGVEQMVERNAARSSAHPNLHISLTFSRLAFFFKNRKVFIFLYA